MRSTAETTGEEIGRFYDHRLSHPGREPWCAFHYRSLEDQRNRHQVMLNLVGPLDGKTLLDVGCGTGDLLNLLPGDTGYIGIDVSEKAVKHARAMHPGREFRVTDELPAADIVMACAVIQHTHLHPREFIYRMWDAACDMVIFNCWRYFAELEEAELWWRDLPAEVMIVDGYDVVRGHDHDFTVRLSR